MKRENKHAFSSHAWDHVTSHTRLCNQFLQTPSTLPFRGAPSGGGEGRELQNWQAKTWSPGVPKSEACRDSFRLTFALEPGGRLICDLNKKCSQLSCCSSPYSKPDTIEACSSMLSRCHLNRIVIAYINRSGIVVGVVDWPFRLHSIDRQHQVVAPENIVFSPTHFEQFQHIPFDYLYISVVVSPTGTVFL